MRLDPSTTIPAASLDELGINALRFLSVDAVQKANGGHPERGLTPGVETTTGPLGQGFGDFERSIAVLPPTNGARRCGDARVRL